jgi:hypothetical protein
MIRSPETFELVAYWPKKTSDPSIGLVKTHISTDGINTVCGQVLNKKWWTFGSGYRDLNKVKCIICKHGLSLYGTSNNKMG